MDIVFSFIKDKYLLSEKVYNKILKDEPSTVFLFYFDILNVYNLFPTIIDFQLQSGILPEIIDATTDTMNKDSFDTYRNENKIYKTLLKKSIKETQGKYEGCSDDKYIRKFFSYEIIDELMEKYNAEYVTVAWLKCYEILEWYNMLENTTDTINYFGICEQPGAFVYAINHYIHTNKKGAKFNFVLQSLKIDISHKKTGFKAENNLYETYPNAYDYGESSNGVREATNFAEGDITNIKNIKYYRKKYYDKHFDLISADCGLDCSDDYTLQEKKIFRIFFGQVLAAISIAGKGTNYFTKLFTIYSLEMALLLQLLAFVFDQVYLSRVLTTKSVSGEVYLICKGFKYDKSEFEQHLQKLYVIYEENSVPSFKDSNLSAFLNQLTKCNETLLYRRIISYRSSYFRYNNRKYTTVNNEVTNYVKDLVDHYTKYYLTHYKIKPLDLQHKLVKRKFTNKWIKN